MLVVHRLAGILLKMQPLDADLDVREFALPVRPDGDDDFAFADDRLLELRYLIALRQVRIEVVLPVEDRLVVDRGLQAQPGADRLLDALLVDHRQHAGHRRVDQADIGVWRGAERGRSAGEELCLGRHLRMHFEPDDDFPVAGGA